MGYIQVPKSLRLHKKETGNRQQLNLALHTPKFSKDRHKRSVGYVPPRHFQGHCFPGLWFWRKTMMMDSISVLCDREFSRALSWNSDTSREFSQRYHAHARMEWRTSIPTKKWVFVPLKSIISDFLYLTELQCLREIYSIRHRDLVPDFCVNVNFNVV